MQKFSKFTAHRQKILFIVEAATLAHVARSYLIASTLNLADFAVYFACSEHYQFVFSKSNLTHLPLRSRSPSEFAELLKQGGTIFDYQLLSYYAAQEVELINSIKPDVVVGDLRPSLSVSTALCNVPLISITNAYWSPFAEDRKFTLPAMNWIQTYKIPGALGKAAVKLLEPVYQRNLLTIFEQQGAGINALRKQHGLGEFENYLEGFVSGDRVLYCDSPALIPTISSLPTSHRYLGPASWSPQIEPPQWWDRIQGKRPIIYINLGSSGPSYLLPSIVEKLSSLDCELVVAIAGHKIPLAPRRNLWCADFLPGDRIAQAASVVICNGGSPTVYQALQSGTPVVGIASNIDQFLTMHYVLRAGCGGLLRADTCTKSELQSTVSHVLNDASIRRQAQELAKQLNQLDTADVFLCAVEELCSEREIGFNQQSHVG